jgi:DNA-binding beta-propeller fold protein YncE
MDQRQKRRWTTPALIVFLLIPFLVLLTPVLAYAKPKATHPEMWELSLDGGRRLVWESSFSSESEVRKEGFWGKVVDVVAGAPQMHSMVRPYSVVTDSRGRIIVTDPGAAGVHVFDFAAHKYKFIQHAKNEHEAMLSPQCVAVDAQDNIYVTDSNAGVIFVFDANGKFQRTIGSLRGGEGYYERPTGIAVDSAAGRIYLSDTLRNKVLILDMQGKVLQLIGQKGEADGDFYFPTELRLIGSDLIVVDAMNFRLQFFDRSGNFESSIGNIGDGAGAFFRPKAVGVDSEGDVYVVDSSLGAVQVFNRKGQLLYYFGEQGTHAGEFQLPSGLYIDHDDRVYVVDSFNHRVQVFHYFGLSKPAGEATK